MILCKTDLSEHVLIVFALEQVSSRKMLHQGSLRLSRSSVVMNYAYFSGGGGGGGGTGSVSVGCCGGGGCYGLLGLSW